jgi:hypothetical protein
VEGVRDRGERTHARLASRSSHRLSWLLAASGPGRGRRRHRRLGPSSWATTSTVIGRWRPRRSNSAVGAGPRPRPCCPSRGLAGVLAWSRHTTTVKNDASWSRRPLTATRNTARAIPDSVCRSSGWSVRLPAKLTLASAMVSPLSVAWPGGLPCPWNRGTVDAVACREATRGKRWSQRSRPCLNSPTRGRLRCRVGWWRACGWVGHAKCRPARSLHPGVVGERGSHHEMRFLDAERVEALAEEIDPRYGR